MRIARIGPLDARLAGGPDGNGGGTGPVVVLLHGFGAPADDLVPLGRILAPSSATRFVFPAAPIDLGPLYMGGRAWWPVDFAERARRQALGSKRDITEVPPGLEQARGAVDGFLDEVLRSVAPAPTRLVLGGFSQGAMLALDTALRRADALAGLILLSGTHIASGEWASRLDARRGLPVFMSHGRQDELLPFAVAEGLQGLLVRHGLPVAWLPFDGGHEIPGRVVEGARDFLGQVLGSPE